MLSLAFHMFAACADVAPPLLLTRGQPSPSQPDIYNTAASLLAALNDMLAGPESLAAASAAATTIEEAVTTTAQTMTSIALAGAGMLA